MIMGEALDDEQADQCKSILIHGRITKQSKQQQKVQIDSKIVKIESLLAKPKVVDLPKPKSKKMSSKDFTIGEKVGQNDYHYYENYFNSIYYENSINFKDFLS